MNSDLEGFDDEEDAGELDALPCEPAIFFVDERDESSQLRTINIVEEDENTQASRTSGRPSNVIVDGLEWSSEDSNMEVPSFRQPVGPSRVCLWKHQLLAFFCCLLTIEF